MAPRRAGVRNRRWDIAAWRGAAALSARQARVEADLGGSPRAALGIRAGGRGPALVGALHPTHAGPALFDHLPDAAMRRRCVLAITDLMPPTRRTGPGS